MAVIAACWRCRQAFTASRLMPHPDETAQGKRALQFCGGDVNQAAQFAMQQRQKAEVRPDHKADCWYMLRAFSHLLLCLHRQLFQQ